MSDPPTSRRELQLVDQTARRASANARREVILEEIVAGETYAAVARRHALSMRTVRREVARALNGRSLEPPDRHVRLQVERLGKTIKALDLAIGAGDYGAVEPLLKVIDKLDRYHLLSRPQSQHTTDIHARLAVRMMQAAQPDQRGAKDQSSP